MQYQPQEVLVTFDQIELPGLLSVPEDGGAIVVFAHGSGSGRLSPRNNAVAAQLNRRGLSTLLFDLLTPLEAQDRANVFDIRLLATRLIGATAWVVNRPEVAGQPIGLFGASTGAAAALVAAASIPEHIGAVVSRGGRPDLAGDSLPLVKAPTLLIVGGNDTDVLTLNRQALARMEGPHKLVMVPGAGHLFEEPGTLEQVAELAGDWFVHRLVDPPD